MSFLFVPALCIVCMMYWGTSIATFVYLLVISGGAWKSPMELVREIFRGVMQHKAVVTVLLILFVSAKAASSVQIIDVRGQSEFEKGRIDGAVSIPLATLRTPSSTATLQAGPLYGAFPVAMSLWRKGCAPRNVFIYLGAFCAMKLPMLTFEVAFLGWSFSLARTLITLPVFIAIALVLEKLLLPGYEPPGLKEADNVRESARRSAERTR